MRTSTAVIALLIASDALRAQTTSDAPARAPTRADSIATIRRGWTVAVNGYTGGAWQPSGFDAGLVWKVGRRPGRTAALLLRVGSFVQDQAVVVGGTQGFFSAAVGNYRFPILRLADVGTELSTSHLRLVGILEAGAALNFNNPMPQGDYAGLGGLLVGLTFGGPEPVDESFGLFVGPAIITGLERSVHFQVALRFQGGFRRRE